MDVDLDELRRGLGSKDPEAARRALDRIPCFPMEPWARELLEQVADTPGHAVRHVAMILLNSFARPARVFTDALADPNPEVRCAAYGSLALRGRLEDWNRVIDGTTDQAPLVREAAVTLLLEWLVGSDVDRRLPLLEDPRRRGEDPRFDAAVARLIAALDGVVTREPPGELRDNLVGWLGDLRAFDARR